MDNLFLDLDKQYKKDVEEFYYSNDSIMLFCGQGGFFKLKIVENFLSTLEKTFIFEHSCFEYSTINDLLLNLYDKIREFVKINNIPFKKSSRESFQEKIFEYIENLNFQTVIFINDFSKLSEEKKFLDFLIYLSKLKNVKIIINSDTNVDLFGMVQSRVVRFNEDNYSYFSSKLDEFIFGISDEEKQRCHFLVSGKIFYINVLNIINKILKVSLSSLFDESLKKKMDFKEFLINKAVSVSLSNYIQDAKLLAILLHYVPIEFLSKYGIASGEAIQYLLNRGFLSKTSDGVKLHDEFVEHFVSKMSVKEKVDVYSKFIEIYENEISQSPNVRILRLSRETMRQIIPHYKALIPVYDPKKVAIPNDFTYLGLNMQTFSQNISIPKEQKENPQVLVMAEANALIAKYEYQKALNVLLFALNLEKSDSEKNSLLELISHCYEKLGDIQNAILTEQKILKYYKNIDYNKYLSTLLKVANLYKNVFDQVGAIDTYSRIMMDDFAPVDYKIQAKFEILELTSSKQEIGENILNYIEFSKDIIKENEEKYLPKCYFKIAGLYEKQEDYREAITYYELSSKNRNIDDNYVGFSCLALSDIYEIQGNISLSQENLENAIECFLKTNNHEELFEIYCRVGAKYKYSNPQIAVKNYLNAMDSAKEINDNFKFAMAIVEIGDILYNLNENKEALMNYFEAKKILKDDKRNMPKILSRIEDMRRKMPPDEFGEIALRYE